METSHPGGLHRALEQVPGGRGFAWPEARLVKLVPLLSGDELDLLHEWTPWRRGTRSRSRSTKSAPARMRFTGRVEGDPSSRSKDTVTGLSPPDALVFRLDGTLWDAAEPTARGWNKALEGLGRANRVTGCGHTLGGRNAFVGVWRSSCPSSVRPRTRPACPGCHTSGEASGVAAHTLFGVWTKAAGMGPRLPLLPGEATVRIVSGSLPERSGLGECFTGAC